MGSHESFKSSPTNTWVKHMEENWRSLEEHLRTCVNSLTTKHVPKFEHTQLAEHEYSGD